MYAQEFWDNIYLNHYQDAPWMDDSWKSDVYNILDCDMEKYAKKSPKLLRLLDYGCGNGHMGYYYYCKGMRVDLSDISQVLIDRLKDNYIDKKGLNIIKANTPKDLKARYKYDVVLAWNLFHHIHPRYWHQFVCEFLKKMQINGVLFISGWDEDDAVIRQDHNKARFTKHPTWCINDLPDYITDLPCKLLENRQLVEMVPVFNAERKFRYFVIKKIEQQ